MDSLLGRLAQAMRLNEGHCPLHGNREKEQFGLGRAPSKLNPVSGVNDTKRTVFRIQGVGVPTVQGTRFPSVL